MAIVHTLSSLHFFPIGSPSIVLTSQPVTHCPGPVTFTCAGTDIGAGILWRVNGSTAATYVYLINHSFPRKVPVVVPLEGVTIHVSYVTRDGNRYITSTLRADDVTVLDQSSLQCLGTNVLSNMMNIEVVTYPGWFNNY